MWGWRSLYGEDMDHERMALEALLVLEGNWLGRSTKPAPHLYPHQWSWDSAFIAIGHAGVRWDRAAVELLTLFEAQWSSGLVPHIVFGEGAKGYWPSLEVWDSHACAEAPTGVATSGICQPPVHALAARRIFEARPDKQGRAFLSAMFEPITAWHDYLHRERAIGSVLAEIWHPWESGMDNSPAWDAALAALEPMSEDIPQYVRVDTDVATPTDRPSDEDYDRYAYLLHRLRRDNYAPATPQDHPFRVRDVLFNSLLVAADRDLAWIAEQLGADGSPSRERASALAFEIDRVLWSEEFGMHVSYDAVVDRQIPQPIAGGFVALLAQPSSDLIPRILDVLEQEFLVGASPSGSVLPTVALSDHAFESGRYWRGPAWVQITWLVASGLETVGSDVLAEQLRDGIISLISGAGFWEYFDPATGEGHGSDRFSWTAALLLDIVSPLRTG